MATRMRYVNEALKRVATNKGSFLIILTKDVQKRGFVFFKISPIVIRSLGTQTVHEEMEKQGFF